ncbi:MAG: phosphoethanolamine--lipid A transferase [Cytophagales bacterium]|nr:phosphoethanolamine--lipid A transferase [Rhizobacter sp.]
MLFFRRTAASSTSTAFEGWNPLTLGWIAAAWMASLANWPLWSTLNRLPEMGSLRGRLFMLALCGMVMGLTALVLTVAAWRWSIKPVLALFLLAAAAGAHFMGAYNVVIDSTMMVNVLQTDPRETRDLLSLRFFGNIFVLGVVPLVWLVRVRVQRLGTWRQLKRNLLGAVVAIALMMSLLLLFFADMSATMRNHKSVRYLINPLNSFYALGVVVADAHATPSGPPLAVGADAKLAPRPEGTKPPLLLLVVGETARASNFSLNGYARPTNPRLAMLDVLSFREVSSCGTSTATSLPCMFSVFGKASFEAESRPRENLLDVLQHAGLAVLWVDNQAGCKGLCERVPNAHANELAPAAAPLPKGLCADGECLDAALLHGLDERIAALPAERRERGVVVVLHQMGSHGPAYWKRSPPDQKSFQPECQTNVLQSCDRQALVNTYDNSIAYTDQVLANAIGWLKGRAGSHSAAMLYVSDHGESLGENNLYLHGLPYAFAPREQTHVPMVMWFSGAAALQLQPGCLKERLNTALSHDNLSHTVLGMVGVQTQVYREALDALAPCRLR